MSRSSHQRQQQQLLAQQQQQMADNDAAAAAAEMFDMFCLATTMRQILGLHRNMCETVGLRPAPLNEFYPKLKAKIRSWKAQALWKKFDARASHRAYSKGNACTGTRVLVIGAGPCGLRTAIEAQLLGAKVVVLEKRDRISRNNVLHLWPFVITDLRNLGAKKFYGKFCAGSIDHISIRQLQCILLKVALLLGVEIHEGVSFESTIEPSEGCGWRAAISPADHAVSHYEFDILIGADGKRNTLEAFKRKEFRGKLAIAITANFINKKTEAEAKAEEISGVAFIFNQTFFKELYHTTGIDLENIVYYKDETHYFVMTAKKHSLIDKGVILQDFADPAELLAPANVNTEKLLDYAREAAEFSTKYQMPNLEFAVNHYGKPDVAMFDFTSMFAAESSCRVIVRKNYRLMQCLVGDSLLEPFWPTGSGCARGFLSSMDAAYAIKLWNNPRNSILGVVAQRESIYRLLAQTTPENLQRDIGSYTVDPATRYPNLNRTSVNVWQVKHLIDCDDKAVLEQTFMDTNALQASQAETPVRRKRRTGDTLPLSAVLLRWIKAQLHSYEFSQNLNEVSDCFTSGKVLCALINRYRPDLVDYNSVKDLPASDSNELAFKILDKELKISRVMAGKDSIELDKVDSKIWLNYLEQICEVFRGEIPAMKHPKLDVSELREKRNNAPDFSKLLQISSRKAKSPMQDVADLPHTVQRRSVLDEEKVKRQRKHEPGQAQAETPRRAKKRRSAEKTTNIEERQQRLKEIEANRQDRQSKRRMQRFQQTQNFYKSLHMLQVNTLLRESDESSPFEDYSIYMYRQQAPDFNDRVKELERKILYPDRERGILSALPRGADEQFSDRIKSMEQRITSRNAYGTDKKPKDLLRAIGKIDSTDWNVREIEKKIEQSKKTETGGKGREKVPKWSKEQFVARQSKMSKPTRQDSREEEKFKEIDQTLKNLDKQLKEGSVLEVGERGKNKVASIAGQFVKKDDTSEEKNPPPIAKSNSKVALAFKKQAASEKCHFCKQTVYLMEKISTEGLILHRSCLKCHHCHTNLRLGGYAFDRDDPDGRFYCTQHFRLPAKAIRPVVRKPGQRKSTAHGSHAPGGLDPKTPEKPRGIAENVVQLDLLDRGQTPERIEFENTDAMSDGEPSEEHIIDENEWSGRNFLQPSADSESDLSSSSDESDDDSESDIFEEANGSPIAQQTLQLATDWIGKQHYSNVNSDDSDDDFYDSSEGLIDDGKDDTEGEEIKKAREMRREEVRLLPLPTNLPTDTETEKQTQVVGPPQDGVNEQKIDDTVGSERLNCDADKISLETRASDSRATASKADIEKIEQNSDRRFSADVDAISEKLYRLNNLMKMSKDIESMAKENLVKSDILKKLSLKEKWLLDNSVANAPKAPSLMGFPGEKGASTKVSESPEALQESNGISSERSIGVPNGDDDRGDGLQLTPPQEEKSSEIATLNVILERSSGESKVDQKETVPQVASCEPQPLNDDHKDDGSQVTSDKSTAMKDEQKGEVSQGNSDEAQPSADGPKENVPEMTTDKMEIEGILDIVKMMDISYIEQSKEPLPQPQSSPKGSAKDVGKMLYEAEHKNDNSLNDALRQIEVKNFAGTMDTIKSQMVTPKISHQGSLDISKYFPNAKEEKQSSAAANKNQKTLKDVDLTKYFPPSPVPQRKASVTTVADRLKKSQTEKTVAAVTEPPKAPPRRQKSMAASTSSTDKSFSIHEHLLDGAIDIQKAPVVKAVPKKAGIRIVKKIVPKGAKAKKSAPMAEKKTQDEADKILDEILQSGQEVRSPSIEYQKLFTEEKSPSEDISERIDRILEETGIDLGLPPKPKKKLLKTKSLGEEEFKRTQQDMLSKEDGDRPTGVQKLLQRFESMSSIKSDESFKLKKTNLSSTCSSLNKSKESLRSRESLKSNSDSMSDLEKTMEYLKSEWKTEATNFLQKKRDTFYANRDMKQAEAEAEAKKKALPEPPQWKHTKYSKFFGIKEKSPEKRKSPNIKRKSPAKVLKKSPREEIMKHRKKVESVSSRRASFEEKIKAEDARLKAVDVAKASSGLENGLGSTDSREVSNNALSKIPTSQNRKDSAELKGNHLDMAQKVLSRRGSGTSGLADILKPPVVKGVRGQPKVENACSQPEDVLKVVVDSVLKGSESSLKDEEENEASLPAPLNQTKMPSTKGSQGEASSTESPQKASSRRGSQVEGASTESPQKLSSRRGSQTEPASAGSPQNVPSRRGSQTELVSAGSPQNVPSRRGSQTELASAGSPQNAPNKKGPQDTLVSTESPQTVSSRKGSPTEAPSIGSPPNVSSRRASPAEVVSPVSPQKMPNKRRSPAKVGSHESPQKVPSRRPSQTEIVSAESPRKLSSSRSSEAKERVSPQKVAIESPKKLSRRGSPAEQSVQASPKFPSRRGSQVEVEAETIESPPATSRRSSNFSETLGQTITIDDITDVDEIFNEIVNELDEEEVPPAIADEVELVAIATDSTKEEPPQNKSQPVNEEFDKIAEHSQSPSTSTPKRASSEDSIEKLFSQFTDDMLVDVEFDSNDEVVAITPRAVLINEDEVEEEDDDNDEKPITVEQAKLKFEPLFPRQAARLPKSASSSMSISPARAESKTKRIVQKLNPSDMAPSVQDMLQKIIPREDSEPTDRIPVAFPRNIYESEEERSISRNQTPDSVEKPGEKPAKSDHLTVVYELAWPARQRTPSPVPESARPPIKPALLSPHREIPEKLPLSRRASETSLKEDEDSSRNSCDIRKGSPVLLPTPRRGSRTSADAESTASRRGSKASLKEDERGSPALLPTPRRASRTSIETHSPKEESPLKMSRESPKTQTDTTNSNELVSAKSSTSPISLREGSNIQTESQAISTEPPATLDNVTPPISEKQRSPLSESISVKRDSTSDTSRESFNIERESPALPSIPKSFSRASNRPLKSPEAATPFILDKPSPSTSDTSREGSNIQRESPALSSMPRKLSNTSTTVKTTSVPVSEKQSSVTSDTSRTEVGLPAHSNASPPKTRENAASKPDSPQSARNRFFSQNHPKETSLDRDTSKIPNSAINLKEKTIEKYEPSKEYKDFLHSKLESPSVDRKLRQSKERSLEWDMEQLPRSPMPRRKFVDMLLQASDKEDSPTPLNKPLPTPALSSAKNVTNTEKEEKSSPPLAKAAQNIPLSTKRLEEWEIIEQLERERRLALIKRDENYTHQVQEASSSNVQPNNSSRQPVPIVNRLISLEEPQSSKLIEYIKQQTLADTTKQRDGSPRSRTPQLASKTSNDDLQKQVEALLKSDSPKPTARPRKPEATEATYEDFARFTRKSVDKDTEVDEPELYESPTASISHNRLSYRQKSPESTIGTYSPTSSMSKSVEHLAPSRPHRSKPTSTMLPENKVDRETKYLMDRSKHLRNMKRDFMEEKIAGNNPYLKKVIQAQKISREPEYNNDDDSDEVDYTLDRYRPKNHTTPRFPTSSAIGGRRRREIPRYPDYSSTATDYSRRPYSPHFSTSSTTGSRSHFVDYFKRSPPSSSHYKTRESSKDSCVIS